MSASGAVAGSLPCCVSSPELHLEACIRTSHAGHPSVMHGATVVGLKMQLGRASLPGGGAGS